MDEEKVIQKFNEYIDKYIKDNRINHAYLLETNYIDRDLLIKLFINKIQTVEKDVSLEEMMKNDDLIILDGDNNLKTEDIENLKEKFKTKSIDGKERIYVINNVEKLSAYAANKLLKFIEEPKDDIIAILVTENKNNVITTIVSRCQILRFFVNQNRFSKYDKEYTDSLFEFILNIEENKERAIAFQNRYDIKKLQDRSYIQEFLNNLLFIYDDVIQYKTTKTVEYFPDYIDKIETIGNYNTIDQIKDKINSIYECIDRLKYNPNIKLLIDKLIIMMSGVDLL